jgi:hypothetical protein
LQRTRGERPPSPYVHFKGPKGENKGEELVYEDGNGYCDVEDDFSGCECDELNSGTICVTMRNIMSV